MLWNFIINRNVLFTKFHSCYNDDEDLITESVGVIDVVLVVTCDDDDVVDDVVCSDCEQLSDWALSYCNILNVPLHHHIVLPAMFGLTFYWTKSLKGTNKSSRLQ
jgi:hypothetical protein